MCSFILLFSNILFWFLPRPKINWPSVYFTTKQYLLLIIGSWFCGTNAENVVWCCDLFSDIHRNLANPIKELKDT